MNTIDTADYDYHLKVLIIGNSGVGKSCILLRYSENNFTPNFYNTIGVDFWDTAGQDRFRTITCSYYRGAHAIMIVYDISDLDSFNSVKNWIGEIEKYVLIKIIRYANENVDIILVGNKCDLEGENRKITYEEGKNLADEYKIEFLETSAKSATNIDIAFDEIAKKVLHRFRQNGINSVYNKEKKKLKDTVQLGNEENEQNNSYCC